MKTVTETTAGGLIVTEDGRFVLTARKSFKGEIQWGLPKGHIDKGESLEQTAAREAREETGLDVEIVRPLHKIDYWFVPPAAAGGERTRVHKFVHFYLMRATGGDPSLHDAETEEVAMLAPLEALARATFPSERMVIEKALGD